MEDMGLPFRDEVNPQSNVRPRASRILEQEYGKGDLFQSLPEEEKLIQKNIQQEDSISKGQYAIAFISFFICGIGMTISWSSVLGLMPYFINLHGVQVQGLAIAAFNIPSLPILLLQTKLDQQYDNKYGRKTAYYFRITIAISILIATDILFALNIWEKNIYSLVGGFLGIGIGQGIAFGSLFQLVAIFPPKCAPFLFMGNGMSSVILLLLSYGLGLLKSASNPSFKILIAYFGTVSGILAFCLVMYSVLMNSKILKIIVAKLERGGEENVALLSEESTKRLTTPMPFKQLLKATRIPIASIFVNLGTTVAVSSFLTYVPSTGTFASLVQALNYAMLVADFLGRQLILIRRQQFVMIKSNFGVLVSVLLRCIATIFFFVYITPVFPWHNDWFSVMFVSFYAMVGGYSNTLIYQYAGASVPPHESSRAASVINVSLVFGVFAAIPLQFIFGPMLSKH